MCAQRWRKRRPSSFSRSFPHSWYKQRHSNRRLARATLVSGVALVFFVDLSLRCVCQDEAISCAICLEELNDETSKSVMHPLSNSNDARVVRRDASWPLAVVGCWLVMLCLTVVAWADAPQVHAQLLSELPQPPPAALDAHVPPLQGSLHTVFSRPVCLTVFPFQSNCDSRSASRSACQR